MRDKNSITHLIKRHTPKLPAYEELYKTLHQNPELAYVEFETMKTIASQLSKHKHPSFDIKTGIAGTGSAAVLRNGSGPTILLRADIDALPLKEKTGLPYASTKRMKDADGDEQPVMHACGHDMHMTTLLAAAELLHSARDEWAGTLVLVFQPAEESGGGSKQMVEAGLYDKDKYGVPKPDICLGAHVWPNKAGTVGTHPGVFLAASDSYKVTLHGKGAHGAQPHLSIDPIVMAAYAITRLQSVVSRRTGLLEQAVVTVGSVKGGSADNIIPDEVVMKLNIRSLDTKTREKMITEVKRVINSEAEASGAEELPTIDSTSHYPVTHNDVDITEGIAETFKAHFGDDKHMSLTDPLQGSEDFAFFGTLIDRPVSYWVYGGIDPELWDKKEKEGKTDDIPANHSPFFAPAIQPTLKTGMAAYACAALTFLKKKGKSLESAVGEFEIVESR